MNEVTACLGYVDGEIHAANQTVITLGEATKPVQTNLRVKVAPAQVDGAGKLVLVQGGTLITMSRRGSDSAPIRLWLLSDVARATGEDKSIPTGVDILIERLRANNIRALNDPTAFQHVGEVKDSLAAKAA